ncbi:hypothetical protein H0H92_007525 [Tricholoma furcatifolium]|nr:hypothetical protein H0H92_007525 [Tricholoma furcatifolium]
MSDGKVTESSFDPVKRTAEIAWNIREALRATLPAPREQFFTVMVPGKVVNLADYSEGFDTDGNPTAPVLPNVTELNQAILCDDMPALSPVQLGPTGKSVGRSYDAAISKLVPAGSTLGVDVKDANALTDEEARYKKAMEWLTFKEPEHNGRTRIDVYTEKQRIYTKVVEEKTKAYNEALQLVKDDPRNTSLPLQRAAYESWVSEHARSYRNLMQSAYMDWVVSGKKEEIEYWFSIVDRDSAMARVEASKAAMRSAVVQDTDGSVEYQKVRLQPSDWAVKAKNKALSGNNQTRTAEWYTWEITRLQKMNAMLSALKDKKAIDPPEAPEPASEEQKALQDAMADFIDKRKAWQDESAKKEVDEKKKQEAFEAYKQARKKVSDQEVKLNSANIEALNAKSVIAQDKLYNNLQGDSGLAASEIKKNEAQIAEYEKKRDALLDQADTTTGTDLVKEIGEDAGVPKAQPDPELPRRSDEDYFTAITVEVSSASSADSSKSHASASSFGASVGWGLWSASANASYSSASSETGSHVSKNACKISFECMRVDIHRSWLRSELFYDSDLTTGPNEFISPGFVQLRDLMEGQEPGASPESIERELERYSTFPMYPTGEQTRLPQSITVANTLPAFLVAANVVLEITGETTDIQTSFQESALSASGSFGYGPFSISANHSQSDSSASASCDATADGCRITIKSPQIIGWVSQMVPALPRLRNQPAPV